MDHEIETDEEDTMANYFVIDFKKYGGSEAFKNVMGHNLRRRNYKDRANIDPARSSDNIVLAATDESWSEYMEKANTMARENGGRALRKGSADFFSIVIDASVIEGWSDDDYIAYLRDAEKWLRERFKGQKILASVIHVDEKKPHLHFTASYFNTERGRWSQKYLAQTKATDLNALLNDFERDIGQKYGLRRGESAKEKAKKEILAAIKIEREEPTPLQRLMGKKPRYYITGSDTKHLARLGRELAIAQRAIKEQAVHQLAHRLEEENRKKEEELKKREEELAETREKLNKAEWKVGEYATQLFQLKTDLMDMRAKLSEYENIARMVGGKDRLAELAEKNRAAARHTKKRIRTRTGTRTISVDDDDLSFV